MTVDSLSTVKGPFAQRRRSLPQRIWASRFIYAYLFPVFALLAVFGYYPPLSAFIHAFTVWDGVSPPVFNGLDNFRAMLQDQDLIVATGNLAKLMVVGLIVGITVPIAVAEVIFNVKNARVSYMWRLLILIPVVVPAIVGVLIWSFIYDPSVGIINSLLAWTGHSNWGQDWLGDYHWALYAMMFVGFPWVGGTGVLIALAALQNISTEVLDSASLDGARGLRRFWSIDLPYLMGVVKLFLITGIIGGIQGFGTQLVLTNGGPGNTTLVPGLYMYKIAFQGAEFGYATAIGLVMFIVILILTIINLRYVRSSFEFEGRAT